MHPGPADWTGHVRNSPWGSRETGKEGQSCPERAHLTPQGQGLLLGRSEGQRRESFSVWKGTSEIDNNDFFLTHFLVIRKLNIKAKVNITRRKSH